MIIDTEKLRNKIIKEIKKEEEYPNGNMGTWIKDAWRLNRIEEMYKHYFGEE